MYSDDDLETAVAAGVIDQATVLRLRSFLAASHRTVLVDEEHFRLISGFNDIFVSIASILLLVALGWIGQAIPLGMAQGPRPLGGLLVAAASWGLPRCSPRGGGWRCRRSCCSPASSAACSRRRARCLARSSRPVGAAPSSTVIAR